jgi:hypothetical protein
MKLMTTLIMMAMVIGAGSQLMKKRKIKIKGIKFIRDISIEEEHLYKYAFKSEKNEKKTIKNNGCK